jgi:hypothetical protein
LVVTAAALLVAVQIVRNSAVEALAPLRPSAAARFWPNHPSVEQALVLVEIGSATRSRRPIDPNAFGMINDAATKAPLSSEPFLVKGVQAQTMGNAKRAAQAFLAAQWRDPRSMAAAYFLADYYFRSGDSLRGLEQTALLGRLSPQGTTALAPYVATYAQNPSNWSQMQMLFRSQPDLEDSVLTVLAQNPKNADSILAISDPNHRSSQSTWLPILLNSLVAARQYDRARAIWSSIGRANMSDLLYDPDFSRPLAPPPFNWTFASSTLGLAERQSGHRLHIIFYGNEDGVLAGQLVLLPPGAYRLQMHLTGAAHPELLRWVLRCDQASQPLESVGLDEAAARGWNFAVPANCPAQWLELTGRSGDIAQQSEVTITGLKLTRVTS